MIEVIPGMSIRADELALWNSIDRLESLEMVCTLNPEISISDSLKLKDF